MRSRSSSSSKAAVARTRTSSIPCPPRLEHMGRADRNHRRRAQVPASCGLAGAGSGLCAGCPRRLHRQRPRAWLRYRQSSNCSARLTTRIPTRCLAELEARVMNEANELGVGAMGFRRASVSLIGCKIAAANRLARQLLRFCGLFECWAFRQTRVYGSMPQTGAITKWLYRDPSRPA